MASRVERQRRPTIAPMSAPLSITAASMPAKSHGSVAITAGSRRRPTPVKKTATKASRRGRSSAKT